MSKLTIGVLEYVCRFFYYLSAKSPGKKKMIAVKYPVEFKDELVRQAALTAEI